MIRSILLALAFVLFGSVAWAQMTPRAADPKELAAQLEEAQFLLAQRRQQVIQITDQLQAAQKRLADLDAYAKACGDQPGCFAPAGKGH